MIDLEKITVNAKGKTKEEVKKEILDQINSKLDDMFKLKEEVKKEPKEEKVKPFLIIKAEEDEAQQGFGCFTEYEGDFPAVMAMLTTGVAQLLHAAAEDVEQEYDFDLLMTFVRALIQEYMEQGKEKNNGK